MLSFAKLLLAIIAIAFTFAMSSREESKKKPRIFVENRIEPKAKRSRGPW